MPHNLYLQSSLVQTRKIGRKYEQIKSSIRWNNIDTGVSLNLAFFVNAAIMVMAAAVFYRNGYFQMAEIQDAHRLLQPILGATIAPIAFAIALLASGQSSTITGTLAGQIVMEGYLNLRIRPWLRRLITRLLAVIPTVLVIGYYGDNATGAMLVLSQVILSLQLPFAIIPLIHAVADKHRMGKFKIRPWLQGTAWLVAGIILALNIKLVIDQISVWLKAAGSNKLLLEASIFPLTFLLALLLIYIFIHPWIGNQLATVRLPRLTGVHKQQAASSGKVVIPEPYQKIAIALDFSGNENQLLKESLQLLKEKRNQTNTSACGGKSGRKDDWYTRGGF